MFHRVQHDVVMVNVVMTNVVMTNVVMLSTYTNCHDASACHYGECHDADDHYANCCYPECHYSVIMLNAMRLVIRSVIMLGDLTLKLIFLHIISQKKQFKMKSCVII
jgi:hypothetical protein